MGRIALARLRLRAGRSLATALAVLAAVASFVLLTSASRGSQLREAGTVNSDYRPVYDILVRPVLTGEARVQHILIGWADLQSNYRTPMDKRALARDQDAAADVVRAVMLRVKAGEPFEQLMAEYSEDSGSARLGGAYRVRPDGQMEPGFQSLALRLNPGEVGVCVTDYGYHVLKRVP